MLAKTIAATLMVALLLFGTMFLDVRVFVEAQMASKWYALIAGTLGCLLVMLINKERRVAFDTLSLVLLSFIAYILFRGLLSGIITVKILLFLSFFFLYLFFRANNVCRQRVQQLIVLVCVAQAVYGILQYFGILHAYGGFKITGSFDNPAGFAASLAVGFPFCFSLRNSRILRSAGVLSGLVIASAVVLSDSRAGIIAVVLSSAIFFLSGSRYIIKHKRRYAVIGITGALIMGALLFFYKKDSAMGRILIWNNSIDMISDNPVAGHGSGSFLSEYMVYQADHFKNNPDSPFLQLADNVSHPFNEYLLLTIEYGLIGLLVLIAVFILILRSVKRITPEILGLLSVAAFACFSYPFRYAFVIAVAAFCFSGLEAGRQTYYDLKRYSVYALSALGVFGCILLVKDISFEYKWGKLAKRSFYPADSKYIENIRLLYESWNGNPYFLYNYGASLNLLQRYDESNAIFSECALHLNDYDVQMSMGDNYMKTERWSDAARHYIMAHDMIPGRFMPLDRLMELYQKSGDRQQALEIACKIVDKKVKIPSGAVSNIKNKAQNIIDEINE